MYMVGGEADYKALLGHDTLLVKQDSEEVPVVIGQGGGRGQDTGVNIRMGETDCENWNRTFKSCDNSRNHFFRV